MVPKVYIDNSDKLFYQWNKSYTNVFRHGIITKFTDQLINNATIVESIIKIDSVIYRKRIISWLPVIEP